MPALCNNDGFGESGSDQIIFSFFTNQRAGPIPVGVSSLVDRVRYDNPNG